MHLLLEAHAKNKQFHHAYLLCGDFETCRKEALAVAEKILNPDGKIEAHPDFLFRQFDLFGIEDSRDLKNWASGKSFYGNGKVFVAKTFAFNNESSNALLKLLEEPNSGVHFFIIAPSAETVTPTLRSRMTVLEPGSSTSKPSLEAQLPSLETAEKFLKDLPNKRMELVKKMADEKKGDKTDKAKIIEFLNCLELLIEDKLKKSETKKAMLAMKELQISADFIFDRGASAKMILEHLALSLPKF